MKKLIFGFGILLTSLTCSSALASDYCYGNVCTTPQNTCCFDGFYLGGNLGVITQLAYRNEDTVLINDKTYFNVGFTLGGQVGYDRSCGCGLIGLVVDTGWSSIDQSYTVATLHRPNDQIKDKLDWYLTIRTRAGVTLCNCLLYATAGAAVAHFESQWNPDATHHFQNDGSRWGWTGGIGVEYLLGYNWSIGADLLFMQFDSRRKSFPADDTFPSGAIYDLNDSVWLARVLLNYRFGNLLRCLCCR